MTILFAELETPVRFKGRLFVLSQVKGAKACDEINDFAFRTGTNITISFSQLSGSLVMYVDGTEWLKVKGVYSLVEQIYPNSDYVHLWGQKVPFEAIPKLDDYLDLTTKLKEGRY